MLRSIVQSSLKSRYLVIVVAAAMMSLGISRLQKMPVDILPEFSPPYVEIQTEALGLSAEEVEQLITLGMEQDLLNGIPWLETIRSESLPGLSSIVLVFKPGTDLMRARQMVAERLSQAYVLPHVSKPPMMLQPKSATSRVLIVGLSSKTLTPIQQSVLARWTIMPRLKGIPGVANVAIWGQRNRQLQVQVDPEKLAENDVSLHQILETTGNALWVSSLSFVEASTPGTGGFIDTANQRFGIRHILPIVSPEGLAQVPVMESKALLGEIANVVEDHQPLIGDALTENGSSLLMVIDKFPGANTIEVTQELEKAFAELLPGLPGMDVNTRIFKPADFIAMASRNLSRSILLGILLAVLLVGAFLLEWRAMFISLVTIPVSFATAGLVLTLSGATLNMIVMTGFLIAIGVVVFDSITTAGTVLRRLQHSEEADGIHATARTILASTFEARRGALYATVILLLGILPVLFMSGLPGSFFRPLAFSYGLAVLVSMLVASTVTPALCLIFLRKSRTEHRTLPLIGWMHSGYEQTLHAILPQWRSSAMAVGILTTLSLVLFATLNWSVLPTFKERNLVVHFNCLPGTSQPEMTRIADRISTELQSVAGVRDVGAHIGRAVLGDQIADVQSAELWLTIDPSVNYDKTAHVIQEIVNGYPGVHHYVQTYLNESSEDVVSGPEDDVVVRIFGETEEGLRARADEVTQAIDGIQGIAESKIEYPVQQATLQAEVDLVAAQRYGLKPGDVRRAAATLLAGIHVGNLYEEQKVFEVIVWSTPKTRHSLSDVGDLLIDTPGGKQVQLKDVASVRMVPTSTSIHHDAVKRYIDVVADVQDRQLGAVASDIEQRLQKLPFPLEYHAEVLGDYSQQGAVTTAIISSAIAAVVGIFFVLQAAFGSWTLAAACLASLPASLAGGLLIAFASGQGLSFGSLAGLLMVFSIATCSMVSLINHYQSLEREAYEPFDMQLALRGASERFVPVLLATLATGALLTPALFLGDLPGLEIVRPMAIVLLGGLLTAGLLNWFLVPALVLKIGVGAAEETDLLADASSENVNVMLAPVKAATR